VNVWFEQAKRSAVIVENTLCLRGDEHLPAFAELKPASGYPSQTDTIKE